MALAPSCGLHVVFHGCAQYAGRIGDVFMTKTGYNSWADANNLVILYPQVPTSLLPTGS